MRKLKHITLKDIAPDSLSGEKQMQAACAAVSDQLHQVSELSDTPSIYARINQLTSQQLDHLAWQFNASVWRDSWPAMLKRSVIRGVIIEKRKMGTRFALQNAVSSFGGAAIIKEWWEYAPPKEPHTFDIVISLGELEGILPQDLQQDLILAIDEIKPVRSHYDLQLATQARGGIGFQGALRTAVYKRITATESPYAGGIGFQGAIRSVSYKRITAAEAG